MKNLFIFPSLNNRQILRYFIMILITISPFPIVKNIAPLVWWGYINKELNKMYVNKIYRFVTMVYYYITITIPDIIHHPVFYIKHNL
jgi:hypothetical protein